MLDAMRKHSQSFLIYLIFGTIIVVFAVNFGPGSTCGGRGQVDYAAKVNGEPIRRQDFAMIYNQRLEMMRRSAALRGAPFSTELAEMRGLRREIIDQLIAQRLLSQEASARGLSVSDAELNDYLEERFPVADMSAEDYEAWVNRNFQQSVTRFERDIRGEILAQRMQRLILDTVAISDEELKRVYEREHDRAMISFVKLDTAEHEAGAAKPTDAEIDALVASDMPALEERYKRDMWRYRTPEQAAVRQVLKKLPEGASDADVARARGVLLDLKSQLEGGADFAALAKQHSDDEASRNAGGELGFIKRGQMARPITDAVFALKKGQVVAEPVRTPQGLHLLQVTDVKPPERLELEAVKREVATSVLTERAADAATGAAAERLLASLRAGKKLEELTAAEEQREDKGKAGASRPVRAETPWILRTQEALPRIGASSELHAEIFALTKEDPIAKKAHKVGRAYYVVVLKDREVPDLGKLDAEKETLERQQEQVRGAEVFDAWVKALRERATVLLNPELFPPESESPISIPSRPSAARP